jgi:hypothetical protein
VPPAPPGRCRASSVAGCCRASSVAGRQPLAIPVTPTFPLALVVIDTGFAQAGFDARLAAPPFWVHRQNDLPTPTPQPFLLSRVFPSRRTSLRVLDSCLSNTVHCVLFHNMMSHDSAGRDTLTSLPPTVQIGNASGASSTLFPKSVRQWLAGLQVWSDGGAELPPPSLPHPNLAASSTAAHRVEDPRARAQPYGLHLNLEAGCRGARRQADCPRAEHGRPRVTYPDDLISQWRVTGRGRGSRICRRAAQGNRVR